MSYCRDTAGRRLVIGALSALCALAFIVVAPSPAAADECAIPEWWECPGHLPEGVYLVAFHEWVEEDPEAIAEEHIALYGGLLGAVYRDAVKAYVVGNWTDAIAEAVRADPRVALVGKEQICDSGIPHNCRAPGAPPSGTPTLISLVTAMVVPTSGAEYPGGAYGQAESICKAFGENLPTLGPRGKAIMVPISAWTQPELRHKGRALRETGRAMRKTSNELSAVEVPDEHQDEFAEWLGFLERAASRNERAGKTLAAGHKAKALHLLHHLEFPPRLQLFEETVGFRYCRLEPEGIAHEVLAFAR